MESALVSLEAERTVVLLSGGMLFLGVVRLKLQSRRGAEIVVCAGGWLVVVA